MFLFAETLQESQVRALDSVQTIIISAYWHTFLTKGKSSKVKGIFKILLPNNFFLHEATHSAQHHTN